METIRLLTARLESDAIELDVQTDNGARMSLRLPMADFILLRLQLDLQAKPLENLSSPLSPRQIQLIHPQQLAVFREPLSGDPILSFGLGGMGELSFQIPLAGLAGMLQQLLPFLSPGQSMTTN